MKKLSLLLVTLFVLQITSFAQKETKDKDYYKYNWKLTDIYADWDGWQKDLDKIKEQIPKYQDYKGKLGSSAETLLAFRKLSEKNSEVFSKLYTYASLNKDIDGKNPMYITKLQKLQTVGVSLSRNTTWIETELAEIPKEKIEKWMNENEELAIYEHAYDNFYRQLEHIIDEETKEIKTYYSRALGAASNIYNSLSKADMVYPKVTLSNGKEIKTSPANAAKVFNSNENQEDRKKVLEAKSQAYAKNKNTYADILMGIYQNRWANAQLRGYESCLDAVLEGNDIPEDVFHNLIEVAGTQTDALYKYRELRKKALGVENYYVSDESYPLTNFEKEYSFDEAVDMVVECLQPMGKEYTDLLNRAVQSGWIDVYEKPGKQTGAYSWSVDGVHPYILMNWAGTRDNVFTLAHELGHSIHSMLTNKYQPKAYRNYASMAAETASTFNEKMLLDYMIEHAEDPNEKIGLLVQAIDNIAGTFYRQSQFAEFENSVYSKVENNEPINAEILGNTYADIDKKYNGDIMQSTKSYKHSWPRVHHFYTLYYYVYNYAVSFSCSSSLFNQIKQAETPEARKTAQEKYMKLLKSGGNDYPVNLLKKAGVDLTTNEPYLAVVNRLDELVNELEVALKEAGKI